MDLKRTRNLTPAGDNLFEVLVEDYSKGLSKLGYGIERSTQQMMEAPNEDVFEELNKCRKLYLGLSDKFIEFLQRTRTVDSERELSAHRLVRESILSKIQLASAQMSHSPKSVSKEYYNPPVSEHEHLTPPKSSTMEFRKYYNIAGSRTPTEYSRRSCSQKSAVSDILIHHKLKHERAKIHLEFMKKESEVLKRRMQDDITLKLLQSEKDYCTAEAELSVVKDLELGEEFCDDGSMDIRDIKAERTVSFVENVATQIKEDIPRTYELTQTPQGARGLYQVPKCGEISRSDHSCVSSEAPHDQFASLTPEVPRFEPLTPEAPQFVPLQSESSQFVPRPEGQQLVPPSPEAPQSAPSHTTYQLQYQAQAKTDNNNNNSGTVELTKYIMKKDLILSRLSQFNDLPERYFVWKSSFRNIVKELDVTPTEELDLLCRWLGPESSKQADSLRAANSSNEVSAVSKIWERLDSRYGAPELVVQSFQDRLSRVPRLSPKDCQKIYELSDLLAEMESLKEDPKYKTSLAYLDSSAGVKEVLCKLPTFMQSKWTDTALRYKREHNVIYPPFTVFTDFISRMAERLNDPGFRFEPLPTSSLKSTPNRKLLNEGRPPSSKGSSLFLSTKKTDVGSDTAVGLTCLIHGEGSRHNLKDCRSFFSKPLQEKKELLKKNGVCYKCCDGKHLANACKNYVKCDICGSNRHCTIFHVEPATKPLADHGGEKVQGVQTSCTEVCKDPLVEGLGKSCAKTVLVKVYPQGQPQKAVRLYAVIDDQSNVSLARTEFFDRFDENGQYTEYSMTSCSGQTSSTGRKAKGYVMESMDGEFALDLPVLLECDGIPNNRHEIPTPEAAHYHRHLQGISQHLQPLDPEADILMLIGRDLPAAHHVLDQKIGPVNGPYAQRLKMGWVVIGEVCLGKVHRSSNFTVNKIQTLADGRPSAMEPCPNCFNCEEKTPLRNCFPLFAKDPNDNKTGYSKEDKDFLNMMDNGFRKNDNGQWEAPLPLKLDRPRLPDNRAQSLRRAMNLDSSLRRDPQKCSHMFEFMSKVFEKGHAEVAPERKHEDECWYLPLFGVYHPKKPNKIRCVFDSSAKEKGLSLNSVLLTGPDLTNSLLGVLLRFRKDPVAIMADVEQMFYCFKVIQEHRNFLRFFWYANNSFENPLIEYRMTAHVFGNAPSPAVATYGLRKAVENSTADVQSFVIRDFYVDDGLTSTPDAAAAVSLIQRTQQSLSKNGGIRLHKVASNSQEVLRTFDRDDLAGDIRDLDLTTDCPPVQRSLGLHWDLTSDSFVFSTGTTGKAYTKRGLLSTINGIFDPIGFAAPVILRGRLFFRDLIQSSGGWDEPLPEDRRQEWESWCSSLEQLHTCSIPRQYFPGTIYKASEKEVHIFSDASKDAVAAVAFLRTRDTDNQFSTSFILGKAKVAPQHGHTIPRLELCAAVLATDLGRTVSDQLDIPPGNMHFYTDSMVVLGYLHNRVRRFYVYVGNRVDRILSFSKASQWSHVSSEKNPADEGTRCVNACDLQESMWLQGSSVLGKDDGSDEVKGCCQYPLVQPSVDTEVRPEVKVLKTSCSATQCIGEERAKRFSTWNSLVRGIACLKSFAISRKSLSATQTRKVTRDLLEKSQIFILKDVQQQVYPEEVRCLKESKALPGNSSIAALTPILDQDGILRVGGRLNRSHFSQAERNPVILPGRSHVARLLVEHFHSKVRHQGRHLTEGAVRSAGYWVTGAKRLISSILQTCVTCRKLRGKMSFQQMSDLPPDRLKSCAPFTYVGVDVFGPWVITTRRTRGGASLSKRWAVLFTCLASRAVHIEVIEEMSSSSFINALRRFISIRGTVQEFRSDNGTNFVGCTDDMGYHTISVDEPQLANFLLENRTVWRFNPPHASHMGGAWERMIGTARRILDSMLLDMRGRTLTHEILTTLMAEVTAIINSRPITPISTDPQDPSVLSPSVLLTQKTSNQPQVSFEHFGQRDLYRYQWKCVQVLAEEFWKKWRNEYLSNLQSRSKWQKQQRNLEEGDIVLMKDRTVSRMEWPLAIVNRVFKSDDKLVRKVEIRIVKDGKLSYFVRPVTEVVFLTS